MRVNLPLMKNVLIPLARSVLIPLGLMAATSATDVALQKKTQRSDMTTLLILNEEIKDIMEMVKYLEKYLYRFYSKR